MLLWVWLAGALMSASTLVVGLWRLGRLASVADRIESGPLTAIAATVRNALNVRRNVTLLRSPDERLLVTWGAARPKVMLPRDAPLWSDERARIVLQHELAHVARGDWLVQMLAEALRAIYWFNPLLWIACRQLREESEKACDDTVIGAGVRPTDYASHLLDLARHSTRLRPALGMARSSSLEGRVNAMLNTRITRQPLRLTTRIITFIAFAILAAPLATAQSGVATFGGTVVDQTSKFVPGAALVLTHNSTAARFEARTDQAGHFAFTGLTPGEYQLVVQQPGFKAFKEVVSIEDRDVSRTIHVQIGMIQETVRVTRGPGGSAQPDTGRRIEIERSRQRAQDARKRVDQKCSGGETPGDVGGQILPPLKLSDTHPEYPDALTASGVGGDVTLSALIGTDGTVRDVTVVSSPHPDLERAAIDAVRQWEFSTTYLNCRPVEVPMRVTISFRAP